MRLPPRDFVVWIQFSRFLLVSGKIPSGRAVMVMPADAVAEAVVMPWLTWSPTD